MEWTGRQQIYFLLQSIALGAVQGLLLDLITGLSRFPKGRRWMWTDIVFGPLAAVITFFGALAIMDGHLHPLLLCGVFFGMVAEHVCLGVWICKLLRHMRAGVRKLGRIVSASLNCYGVTLCNIIKSLTKIRKKFKKMKKDEF